MTRTDPPLPPPDLQGRRSLLFRLHRQVPQPEDPEPNTANFYRTVSPGFARDFQDRAARSLDRPSLTARRKTLFF
ncbi:hypothetical protein [Tropicibacter oceani]|uniref:Uncharacterized protein n=1 Tax=Tropicibacter oceani TaxID=3058420 RepID=A0ABY8QEB9_9RHOB|nr:hypothetical protein [Tropicibacter oceani]WGW02940.1 hypothetical protein QF118_13490 [Tropicibacter oceani]